MSHRGDRVQEECSIQEERLCICGWPTDTLSIDLVSPAHTLILFIPGNPGVVHWYTTFLTRIVQQLGRGFAVRGLSYAGHGIGDDVVGTWDDHSRSFHGQGTSEELSEAMNTEGRKDMRVPWTMEGQSECIIHRFCRQ
jgi:hypothetical protein